MLKKTVTILNEKGLHARPAGMIAQLVPQYDALMQMTFNNEEAACESPLDMLMLQASKGSVVTLHATGPEAEKALEAVSALIESGFGE